MTMIMLSLLIVEQAREGFGENWGGVEEAGKEGLAVGQCEVMDGMGE